MNPDGMEDTYGHLSGIVVSIGNSVSVGQHIGFIGNTGSIVTPRNDYGRGTHLHFVRRQGLKSVNPEPIGGYTGIRTGDRLTSQNLPHSIIPVGLGSGNQPVARASKEVLDVFMGTDYGLTSTKDVDQGRNLFGEPIDDGGAGQAIHEWGAPSRVTDWDWYGYYIQNFDGGSLGNCAIVYNPTAPNENNLDSSLGRAFVLKHGSWNVFRYGTGDGSGYGPTISVAGRSLGFPLSNEFLYDGLRTRQKFEGGYLEWGPIPGDPDSVPSNEATWGVNVLTLDGSYLFTTTPDGPRTIRSVGRTQTSIDIAFESTAGAHSYLVFGDGMQIKAVESASMLPQKDDSGDGPQPALPAEATTTLSGLQPGTDHSIQVIAVDSIGATLSRTSVLNTATKSAELQVLRSCGNQLYSVGADAYLWVVATGPEEIQVSWLRDGESIGSGSELIVGPLTLDNAGKYQAVISDQTGASMTEDVYVVLKTYTYDDWTLATYLPEAFRASRDSLYASGAEFSTSGATNYQAYLNSAKSLSVARKPIQLTDVYRSDEKLIFSVRRPTNYYMNSGRLEISRNLADWRLLALHEFQVDATAYYVDGVSSLQQVRVSSEGEPSLFVREVFPDLVGLAPVIRDEFNDAGTLNDLFTTTGDQVEIADGSLKITTQTTDNGGKVSTVERFPGDKRLRIVSRKALGRGSASGFPRVNMPSTKLMYLDRDGVPRSVFSVFYAEVEIDESAYGGLYRSAHGTYIAAGDGNPHIAEKLSKVVGELPVTWGTWFTEMIDYDPARAALTYYASGEDAKVFRVPLPPDATEVYIQMDAWGWWTGHFQYVGDMACYVE